MTWYCVKTRHKQEINTDLALTARGYEVYLPLTLKDRRYRKHSQIITEPLFRQYLFVALDEGKDDFHTVGKCPGVTKIVALSEREIEGETFLYPTSVPGDLITELRQMENEQGIHDLYKADYAEGDEVRITSGPFKNVTAKVYQAKGEGRVMILLDAMHKSIRMDVEYRHLEPINA